MPSIYDLKLPSKNDHFKGVASTITYKKDIWNAEKSSKESFSTNFNYSSVSGVAVKPGESIVDVLMAIEYPDIYAKQKNFFSTKVRLIVSEEISAPINKYIDQEIIKQSIIHFIPPHCKHHLVTNKDSKMRLHY